LLQLPGTPVGVRNEWRTDNCVQWPVEGSKSWLVWHQIPC